ncbi:MAG: DUF4169 family protein [Alphaproteobacteria bacterium]|jgi:hypothetical protein
MGDIVNLNQFRKRRERELKEERAEGNRQKSGQKKSDHKALSHDIDQRRRELDGKRLDRGPSED